MDASKDELRCTRCSAHGLEAGFIEDTGQSATGNVRWIAGRLERGMFGGAKRRGRSRWQLDAFRCPGCGHLELFATQPM
ncbi:hypothetical protein LO772_12330 [Yinghuangia sp. ASG 101]|uniref:hypothetical protein n=1 Tax=Yinghuangia sp. ASG 101 TaxID=2896848 RepID=UPI001E517079|nr:hypothetical protein [Yinghuangia sp. ASG 101]UGQ14302.1 hypothetical protein LO772_12330 [Yinghuangia sp. ASG 101]